MKMQYVFKPKYVNEVPSIDQLCTDIFSFIISRNYVDNGYRFPLEDIVVVSENMFVDLYDEEFDYEAFGKTFKFRSKFDFKGVPYSEEAYEYLRKYDWFDIEVINTTEKIAVTYNLWIKVH